VLEYALKQRTRRAGVCGLVEEKKRQNGAFAIATLDGRGPVPLLTGKGKYTKLTWDEKQTQLVLLTTGMMRRQLNLDETLSLDRKAGAATELVSTATPNFKPGFVISERGAITSLLMEARSSWRSSPSNRKR